MKLDKFILKIAALDLKLEGDMEIVSEQMSFDKLYKYYDIKVQYKEIPIFFTFMVEQSEEKIDIEELKNLMRQNIEQVSVLKDLPFSNNHVNYILNNSHFMLGKEFEKIESENLKTTQDMIKGYLSKLSKENDNSFKEIYLEFMEKFKIEKLKNKITNI